jgi:hypothetical protein
MADSLPPSVKIGSVIEVTDWFNVKRCNAKIRTIFRSTVEVEYIDGPEDGRKVEIPFSHFIKSGEQ